MSVYVAPSATYATYWPSSMLNAPKMGTVPLPVMPSKEQARAHAYMMSTYAYTMMSPAEEARLLRAPKMGTVELPDDEELYDAYPYHTTCVSPRTRQSSAAVYSNALDVHFGYDRPQMAQSSPVASQDHLYCDHPAYESRTELSPGMYSRLVTPQSPSYPYAYARSPSLPSPQCSDYATYGYSPRKSPYMSPPPSPPPASVASSPRANATWTPRTTRPPRLSP